MYLSNLSEVSVTQKTAQQKIGLKDGEGNKSPGHHRTKKSTVTFQHTLSGPRGKPIYSGLSYTPPWFHALLNYRFI